MDNYSKNIGVFGNTMNQAVSKIQGLLRSLPKEEVVATRLSIGAGNCFIDMENGDRYIALSATQGARGYRWKQVYVPYNVDIEIFEKVIFPKLISNLPEHEQVIGYWFC